MFNLAFVEQPEPRPIPFTCTHDEAVTVIDSLFSGGKEPLPAPGTGGSEPAATSPTAIKVGLRVATKDELYIDQTARTNAALLGYKPYIIEWLGPAIQNADGTVSMATVAPPSSNFAGQPVPSGFVYWAEYAATLVDRLKASPGGNWYLLPDGSVRR